MDPLRKASAVTLRRLHAEGLHIGIPTGDSRTTAEAAAQKLGIDEVWADVLPDGKMDAVKALQAQVGIAVGTCTDVAIACSGVTLIKGDPRGTVRARHLSHRPST